MVPSWTTVRRFASRSRFPPRRPAPSYRRDGGENHDGPGRIALAVTQSRLAGDPAQTASLLQQLAAHPNATGSLGTFIRALQAIVTGRRDRTLADAPDLSPTMAAEILFLIETLEKPR